PLRQFGARRLAETAVAPSSRLLDDACDGSFVTWSRERWSALGSSVKGLQCRECGELYPAQAIHVCEMCFGPLEVAYDYDVIGNRISRASIAAGPASLWRYKPLLPIEGDRYVDSQAGYTPLVR